jgi:hypothetical protein
MAMLGRERPPGLASLSLDRLSLPCGLREVKGRKRGRKMGPIIRGLGAS